MKRISMIALLLFFSSYFQNYLVEDILYNLFEKKIIFEYNEITFVKCIGLQQYN